MKLLAIDGNSIMNRAFYGIKMLSNKQGMFTNAITGFMNIFLKVTGDLKPDAVAVAFDVHAKTFRHKAVETYKANRKGMPDELRQQMPVIKEILTAMGVTVIEKEGFEADDVLGTLSKLCTDKHEQCFILTGDRDSLQLINDDVTILLHTTKELLRYTEERFKEDYGIKPIELIDLKALMGDSSDNISGVKGIGEKTATTLIKEFHTVEELYSALEQDKVTATKSVLTKLSVGAEDAKQSKWLATIVLDAPVDNNLDDYILKEKDTQKLSEILSSLEMFKLLDKLKVEPSEVIPQVTEKSVEKISYEVAEINADILKNIITTKSIVSFIGVDNNIQIVYSNKIYTISELSDKLLFLSSDCQKNTFDAKPFYILCFQNNCELKNIVSDADILGYLLDASSTEYTISRLCQQYNSPYYSDMNEYADIASLPQLCDVLEKEIDATEMKSLLTDIEQPLTEVLASMEYYGVKVDRQGIIDFGNQLTSELKAIVEQIYFMAGKEFNVSSPKQLGVVLFEEMGLPAMKKTKTGYSTNADVLENLRDKHPIIDLIIQYRQLTKLNSTYVEGLLKVIADDGRVHSNYRQTETRTGRISSTEPNVQNIPVRTELGRNMRKFFVAKDGYTLLDADYSQIELRILACMSGDTNMQKAFLENMDIHTATASQVFNMPPEMVTSQMRRSAKAVNFGIVYGIGAFSLSKDIDVSVSEADKYIKNYFATYPMVKKFMDSTIEKAEQDGYVTTLFGRRRYIPELSATNKNIQAFGKRAAMNAPIQGTAADVIKIAMVRVYNRLKKEQLDAHLILQVHDELIIEVAEKDVQKSTLVLGEEMKNATKMAVPLTADVEKGKSWYQAKG